MSKKAFSMNVTRVSLLAALETVKGVAAGKSSLPILSCVCLTSAGDGRLTVRATDLDREVIAPVLATAVTGKGSWAVHAKDWHTAVKMAPTEELIVTINGKGLLVMEWAGGLCELVTLDGAEMPNQQVVSKTTEFCVPGPELRRLLEVGLSAASEDETRHVLNGALLKAEGSTLTVVGTDGRRLADAEVAIEGGVSGDPCRVVVPTALAEEIVALIDHRAADTVSIAVDPSGMIQVGLDGGRQVTGKLIDGMYPNYRQVIPETTGQPHLVRLEDFLAVVKRAEKFCTEGVVIEMGAGKVVVEGQAMDRGRWREEWESEDRVPAVKLKVFPKYLLQLSHLGEGAEVVEFWLTGPEAPMRVVVPGTGLGGVIMPMRMTE